MKKSINIIGAGRAAQPIAAILQHHPYYYMQAVFSRSLNSATDLAARIGAQAVADIACLPKAEVKSKSCCKFTLSNPSQLTN